MKYKTVIFLVLIAIMSCTKQEPIEPPVKVDVVTMTEQEGVLIVTPNRYDPEPTYWSRRGKVVNPVWVNGVLVSGEIYYLDIRTSEFEILGRQAVIHFSPDPGSYNETN